ncbi:hypothetical protein EYR38_000003 [Pleurotus pulmonarius]|nr:hypothetical protein EYR38_000003 [Pleurotus pulmonarius]
MASEEMGKWTQGKPRELGRDDEEIHRDDAFEESDKDLSAGVDSAAEGLQEEKRAAKRPGNVRLASVDWNVDAVDAPAHEGKQDTASGAGDVDRSSRSPGRRSTAGLHSEDDAESPDFACEEARSVDDDEAAGTELNNQRDDPPSSSNPRLAPPDRLLASQLSVLPVERLGSKRGTAASDDAELGVFMDKHHSARPFNPLVPTVSHKRRSAMGNTKKEESMPKERIEAGQRDKLACIAPQSQCIASTGVVRPPDLAPNMTVSS